MKSEEVEKLLDKRASGNTVVQISFKTRSAIKGIFIKTADYDELSGKNLWRIVSETHIADYTKSTDTNLARIFNGAEFTRLSLA